ncbi:hypothetical protein GCM10027414_25540 [Humibacter ginsengiterrae]
MLHAERLVASVYAFVRPAATRSATSADVRPSVASAVSVIVSPLDTLADRGTLSGISAARCEHNGALCVEQSPIRPWHRRLTSASTILGAAKWVGENWFLLL